jgi:RNA polymerase sigma-70 factor (ECF subfamily)
MSGKAFDSFTFSRGAFFQQKTIADPLKHRPPDGTGASQWWTRVSTWELGMNIHAGGSGAIPLDRNPLISEREANARFARIVLPHLDDAYALARWITGNRVDAEDVVQDSCLRAFRAIGGFAEGTARAWVLTIVRHAAYQWLRKNRPAALVFVEDLELVEHQQANFTPLGADTPESAFIAKATAERLKAAIAALPTPFREVMVLRDLQGLAYREIAAVTQVPIGTVMSRLARARRRLIQTAGIGDSLH